MSQATTLRFGWNVDLEFSMDLAFTFREIVAFCSLLVLHPMVLYLLYTKKSIMHSSLRFAYISEQISLIVNELIFSILTRPYPLFPFSGLHVEGPLGRGILPKADLMFLVGFAVVADVPSFILLIMRMHTATAEMAGSKLNNVTQAIVMTITTTIMVVNWFAFGSFARDSPYYDQLAKLPEITALSARGGTNVLFGVPGDLGVFRMELYLLIFTVIICMPLPAFLSAHARFLIANGTIALSEKAQHAQARLSRVFFLQMIEFAIFFVGPLLFVFGLMFMDVRHWPGWLLAILRPMSVVMMSLESTILPRYESGASNCRHGRSSRRFIYYQSILERPVLLAEKINMIPQLPDDLLLMIFDNLTLNERTPLETANKRFRNLDFELGKKSFENISVNSTMYYLTQASKEPLQGDCVRTKYCRCETEPIHFTYHDMRLFRNTMTKSLDIKIDKADCSQVDIDFMLTLLNTTKFEILTVDFASGNDSTSVFLPSLMKNARNNTQAQVYLSWKYSLSPIDISHIRIALLTLPSIMRFKLNRDRYNGRGEAFTSTGQCIVNDEVLLHITSQTKYAVMNECDCTVMGIENVLKEISMSEHKYVEFFAPTSVAEQVITMPNMVFEIIDEEHPSELRFMDRRHQTVIEVDLTESWSRVSMRNFYDHEK